MNLLTNADISEYGSWMRSRGLSERTISLRTAYLRNFDVAVGGVRAVSTEQIMVQLSRYDGWSRRTYYGHLVSAFDWLRRRGDVAVNPLRDEEIKKPPSPSPRPKPLTPDEEAAILSASDGDLRAWLLLGLREGLRVHEIAKMRGEDIVGRYLIVHGKGGTVERLPVHPEIREISTGYPVTGYWFRGHDGTPHVSTATIQRRVRGLFTQLGLDGNTHRCRATYGTTLLRNGANIETVRRLMRHSSLSSTQHYLGVDEDELISAIGTLGVA